MKQERNNRKTHIATIDPFNTHKVVINDNRTYLEQWALLNPLADKFNFNYFIYRYRYLYFITTHYKI